SSFFFSSRRRHTRFSRDWSSDVCSSDLFCPKGLPGDVGSKLFALEMHLGHEAVGILLRRGDRFAQSDADEHASPGGHQFLLLQRSEERRVGKERGAGWAW